VDLPDILCRPEFKGFPAYPTEKADVLWNGEEIFRLLYKTVESIILSDKEAEERVRLVAEGR